jgi:Beta-propeller repeat
MSTARFTRLCLALLTPVLGALLYFGVPPILRQQPSTSVRLTDEFKANHPAPKEVEVGGLQTWENYSRRPLNFEVNEGQSNLEVDFLSRGAGYTLSLSATEIGLSLELPQSFERTLPGAFSLPDHRTSHSRRQAANFEGLRLTLVGANPRSPTSGLDQLPGKVNYFLGSDSSKWRSNINTYAKVEYKTVYPGVDLIYYGNQGQLEYDFIVASKVDPKVIELQFDGAEKIEVDSRGDLSLQVGVGPVLQMEKPRVYQDSAEGRQEISSSYVLDNNRVSFQIGNYDSSRPLMIDPVLVYSTHFGGSDDDAGYAIAVNAAGDAYITGDTNSSSFPLAQPLRRTSRGSTDAFVTKLSADGSKILYSTYFGGGDADVGYGISVDPSGQIYITGDTSSTDFPLANALQPTIGGPDSPDIFVAKLSADGSRLIYSTYIGGRNGDRGNGIAADSDGNAYVAGFTNSTDFPTAKAFQRTFAGGNADAIVLKLNPKGSALVYSTYFGGGNDRPDIGTAVATDSAGNAYVTGFTNAVDFPTVKPMQRFAGPTDVFVAKFDPSGSPVYSTYLGGNADDQGMGIAVDSAGSAYITGETESIQFPTTNGALSRSCVAVSTRGPMRQVCQGGEGFIAKLSADGSSLVYSTYLNGVGFETGRSIAVDAAGNAYVTGFTGSSDFPAVDPLQGKFGGGKYDAFVLKLNPSGSALDYSTFLGGRGDEGGYGIAVDGAANAYVVGYTDSSNFPTKRPMRSRGRPMPGDSRDVFIARIAGKRANR